MRARFAPRPRCAHYVRDVSGFTIIELLVVVAVIGILVLLLLPAINSAREAARTTQCKNNLRQVALAIVNHETTYGHYPISQTASGKDTSGGNCRGGFFSWHARILPFIEEDTLFDQIDFGVNLADTCNDGEDGLMSSGHPQATIAMTVVETFLCPSDGYLQGHADIMRIATAPDNYAANAGWPSLATGYDGERSVPAKSNGIVNVVNPRQRGPWKSAPAVRAKHVRDGLSKTAAVAERLIQRGTSRESIVQGSTRTQSFHLTERPRTLGAMNERCSPNYTHSDLQNSAYLGRSWISGWTPTGPTYMHVKPPNTNHCHFSHSFNTGDFIVTPSSHHTGGVNVAFTDGHVEFITDDVDTRIWWSLGSRNGGEVDTRQ